MTDTIIYIGGFEMPDKNAAAHRVLNNAKIFKDIGYDVVFCGVDKSISADSNNVEYFDEFASMPTAYPKSNYQWIKSLLDFNHIKRVIKKYPNTKFVIAYNMHAIPLSKLRRYCKKSNIKLIADITEWYDNRISINPVKFIKWIDTNIVMRILHKRVNGIIAISDYLKNYYSKYVCNIVQLPPLVDINDPIWNPKNVEYWKSGIIKFVYTGNPGRSKDKLETIIKYLYKYKNLDFKFSIYGLTKDDFLKYNPSYREIISSLENKLEFFGRVSHEESVNALYQSDYCIILRDRTRKNMAGFPTKFVECVTSGVGIIANDFSDISKYYPMDNYYMVNRVEELEEVIYDCISNGRLSNSTIDIFHYSNYLNEVIDFLNQID
ncbi:hypothetical protein [Anaerococcus nagyae]|uniref:hypothetical protein n=1 Tax=Anaerococcus nagyae TaxID=1755241 RepID=UPI001AE92551|nr:hypothetical protein [Anaerococcus nagyae]MBP2068993.1 hypothetical protein [Anaerococcus nagyae]